MVSAAICLTALIGCLSVSAANGEAPVYTVATVEGKKGETVGVNVTGADLTEICGQSVNIIFAEGLEIVKVYDNNEKRDLVLINNETGGEYNILSNEDGTKTVRLVDIINFPEYGETPALVTASFDVTISVTIPADASAGTEYPISIDESQFADYDEAWVYPTFTNGKITVTEDHVHTEATCEFVSATDTEFIYSCTCTTCDETFEKRIPISETTSNIQVGRTIKPANDISLWFMFPKTATEGFTNLILLTEKEVYAPNEDTPTIEQGYIDEYEDGIYMGVTCDSFVFDKLAAYEMGNLVSAKLYGQNSDGEMQLLKVTSYSIDQFIYLQLNDPDINTYVKKTFVDILNYGAASQLLPDIMANVNNLVNKDLTPELAELGTPESEYCTPDTDFDYVNKPAEYNESAQYGKILPAVTIAPESKVNMYFMMNTEQFTGSTDDLYCKFYYKDVMGNPQEYVCKYDGTTRNGNPAFKFDLQPIAQLNSAVKAVFYYGDPNNSGEWMTEKEYSLTAFIKSQIGNPVSPEVGKVLQTIYAYGYSLQYCINNGLV